MKRYESQALEYKFYILAHRVSCNGIETKTFRTMAKAVKWIGKANGNAHRAYSFDGRDISVSGGAGHFVFKDGKRISLRHGFGAIEYDLWTNWATR